MKYYIWFVPVVSSGSNSLKDVSPNYNSSVLNDLNMDTTYIVMVVARDVNATWSADPIIFGRTPVVIHCHMYI